MRIHDVAMGPIIVSCGIGLWVWSLGLPTPGNAEFGPGTFPRLMAAGLALSGLAVGIRGWRMGGGPLFALPPWIRDRHASLRFAAVLVAIVFYRLTADLLGFLICGTLLLTMLLAVNGIRPLRAFGVALAIAIVVNIAFASFLHVPLPWGPLDPVSGYLIW